MEQIIETNVRPALIPLLQGRRPRLTYKAQRSLGAWAWKTAAMISFLGEKESWAITEEELRWFYERKIPPFRSMIWIGEYEGDEYREWYGPWSTALVSYEESAPQRIGHNAYSIPFTVGPVFFAVFGISASFVPPLGPRGALDLRLQRIWPTGPNRAFDWPPGEAVTDLLIQDFEASVVHLGPGGGLIAGIPGSVWGPPRPERVGIPLAVAPDVTPGRRSRSAPISGICSSFRF